jgi:hypothetical protein
VTPETNQSAKTERADHKKSMADSSNEHALYHQCVQAPAINCPVGSGGPG